MSFWREVKRKTRQRILALKAEEAKRALSIMERPAAVPMAQDDREFVERFRARVEEMHTS